ncbi:MAG TPA: galactokinase family protein, partial [Segetibacter sp.]|nr:galactokinase family protein [Segetibacter sp.]
MIPEQSLLVEKVLNTFQTLYKEEPMITRSPGRVNIIGEHLDYNEGYVLPAAIDKAIYVGISKRNDDKIHLHSVDYNEDYQVSLQDIKPTKTWATYVLGVTDQLI